MATCKFGCINLNRFGGASQILKCIICTPKIPVISNMTLYWLRSPRPQVTGVASPLVLGKHRCMAINLPRGVTAE